MRIKCLFGRHVWEEFTYADEQRRKCLQCTYEQVATKYGWKRKTFPKTEGYPTDDRNFGILAFGGAILLAILYIYVLLNI